MQPAAAERLLNLLQVNLRTVAQQGEHLAGRLAANANALLRSLYDGLLAPVATLPNSPLAEATHLLIVPHGPLHYLPFHALYDGEQYLANVLGSELSAQPGPLAATGASGLSDWRCPCIGVIRAKGSGGVAHVTPRGRGGAAGRATAQRRSFPGGRGDRGSAARLRAPRAGGASCHPR